MKPPQAGEHFLRPRKNIAHVLKNRKADVVIQVRHSNVGKPHLQVVEEHRASAHWESRERVAGTCLIQPESPMRVAPSAVKTFRQWDQRFPWQCRLRRIQKNCAAKRVLNAYRGGTREDEP